MNWLRIGSVLSALGSLIWLIWPGDNWHVEPEPGLAFLSALTIWIWREIADSKSLAARELDAHLNDVELAKRVQTTFDSDVRRFLRNESFGSVFRAEIMDRLYLVESNWIGVEYRFEDADLDNKLSELLRLNSEFCAKMAEYSGPAGRSSNLISVPTDEERSADEFSAHTVAHIDELRGISDQLLEALEKLQQTIKVKVPKSFVESSWRSET